MIDNNLNYLDNLSEEERKVALEILKQYAATGNSDIYKELEYSEYDEVPVDITTFLHDRRYLGNGLYDSDGHFTVYPYWESCLKDIFPDNITTKYNTVILTGAIGLGKTFIGVICQLYLLYRLLCLKDPYLTYGLQPIDKISISLMNITLENARGVALDKMNQLILTSPWFLQHGEMSGDVHLVYRPEKHIEVIAASSNNQIIGRALFCNLSDEVNFSLTNNIEKSKQKLKTIISQVDARMKSRYMRTQPDGSVFLPTLNIIVSSKNSEQSFLDEYISNKKKIESKTTLIVDEPQWVVDSRKDSPIKFYVAIGNKFLANEVLPLNVTQEELDDYTAKGYRLLQVPIGYLENFQTNLEGALTDIAGIATASALKYISGVRWNDIKTGLYVNPFASDIISTGTAKDDFTQYSDFFDTSKVTSELKAKPLYIHLDMSKKGDKTGIAGVYITGKKPKVAGEDSSKELFFRVAFSVSVEAPRGYEISFDKHRMFIRWLREQGFNIKGISYDTFQSAQIGQQLTADGFATTTISVDRVDADTRMVLPYAYLKSAIYDRRLEVYKDCRLLTDEVLGLERESDGHIQHPEQGTQGSKDQIDAVCGALWNASKHAEEFAYDYGEDLDIALKLNEILQGPQAERRQRALDFRNQLLQSHALVGNNDKSMSKDNLNINKEQAAFMSAAIDGLLVF